LARVGLEPHGPIGGYPVPNHIDNPAVL
jgi:hypothetical protein